MNSLPANDIWQQNSSKSSGTPHFSGIRNNRPVGSSFTSPDFSAPVQDGSFLSHFQTKGLQAGSLNSQENSSAEQQPEAGTPPSARALLSSGNNQSMGEKQAALVVNANGSPKAMRSPVDGGSSPPIFPSASGHNSPHQQNPGMNLHPQPPLPEKKRTSEGERSFGSGSPSSSGFSSPNSGSTISIPFPNVLPDFSKVLNTPPLPGRLLSFLFPHFLKRPYVLLCFGLPHLFRGERLHRSSKGM